VLRGQIGGKKVLLALSGGVDSSVVPPLLIKAVGKQLTCVFVNHGLCARESPKQVVEVFRNRMDANLVYVDAADRYLLDQAGRCFRSRAKTQIIARRVHPRIRRGST
jgi:GMP synthase (glutamine-hydrolysing)